MGKSCTKNAEAGMAKIRKELNSKTFNQFRSIALLNVFCYGKKDHHLRDGEQLHQHQLPKGRSPRLPRQRGTCVNYLEQIQTAKREKRDLHVVWLDLANAYGSVPHQLIAFVLDHLYIPENSKTMMSGYFQDLQMRFELRNLTSCWQSLEVGIAMGCSISPILFVAAFEVILSGARQIVKWHQAACRSRTSSSEKLYG